MLLLAGAPDLGDLLLASSGEDPVIHNQVGFQSSPAVVDGTVYIGCRDAHVYAVDAATGRKKWDYPTSKSWVISTPAVRDGMVYVGTSDSSPATPCYCPHPISWRRGACFPPSAEQDKRRQRTGPTRGSLTCPISSRLPTPKTTLRWLSNPTRPRSGKSWSSSMVGPRPQASWSLPGYSPRSTAPT